MREMTDRLVRDLGCSEFSRRLAGDGLGVHIGPFNAHFQVSIEDIWKPMFQFYSDYPVLGDEEVFSFRVRVQPRHAWPKFFRQVVRFEVDGQVPHEDLPLEQALPVLEWGVNLVIALRSHAYLMLHTAVVEKGGKVLLLPAAPGFGKSTLCAALVYRGWRLLSDEFGLIRPHEQEFVPVPRPIALKNESIEIIRKFAPEAFIGPIVANTRKGTVAHVAPPVDSVKCQSKRASARWIVYPRWVAGASLTLDRLQKSDGFMKLALNAFNYDLLGEKGFSTVRAIIDGADCYRLVYSDLNDAIAAIDELADGDEP